MRSLQFARYVTVGTSGGSGNSPAGSDAGSNTDSGAATPAVDGSASDGGIGVDAGARDAEAPEAGPADDGATATDGFDTVEDGGEDHVDRGIPTDDDGG